PDEQATSDDARPRHLLPVEREPEDERDAQRDRSVRDQRGFDLRAEPRARKDSIYDDRRHDAEERAEHPGRKKRTKDVQRRAAHHDWHSRDPPVNKPAERCRRGKRAAVPRVPARQLLTLSSGTYHKELTALAIAVFSGRRSVGRG